MTKSENPSPLHVSRLNETGLKWRAKELLSIWSQEGKPLMFQRTYQAKANPMSSQACTSTTYSQLIMLAFSSLCLRAAHGLRRPYHLIDTCLYVFLQIHDTLDVRSQDHGHVIGPNAILEAVGN